MCCETCAMEKTDPIRYKLTMAWRDHCSYEEFYHRTKSNSYMLDYHKSERLKLEKQLREHRAKLAA